MQKLQGYGWPGNVRELANVVERMAILIPDGLVDIDDLPDKFPAHQQQTTESSETIKAITNSFSQHAVGSSHQLPENGINLKNIYWILKNTISIALLMNAMGSWLKPLKSDN